MRYAHVPVTDAAALESLFENLPPGARDALRAGITGLSTVSSEVRERLIARTTQEIVRAGGPFAPVGPPFVRELSKDVGLDTDQTGSAIAAFSFVSGILATSDIVP